jgi:very-short-patch-repair endonuclease
MKKQNVDRARELRRDSTEAETALWRCLRDRGADGEKFVRQEPIGPFIADFVCRSKKLIVEIDGGQHVERAELDEARTRHLESLGYRVMRFWNNEVLQNLEGVWMLIQQELSEPSPRRGAGRVRGARDSAQKTPTNAWAS